MVFATVASARRRVSPFGASAAARLGLDGGIQAGQRILLAGLQRLAAQLDAQWGRAAREPQFEFLPHRRIGQAGGMFLRQLLDALGIALRDAAPVGVALQRQCQLAQFLGGRRVCLGQVQHLPRAAGALGHVGDGIGDLIDALRQRRAAARESLRVQPSAAAGGRQRILVLPAVGARHRHQ